MILLKLLGAWGWLKQALGSLLDLIRRYPLAAALIASLCLSLWLWRGKERAESQRDKARAQIVQVEAASAENARKLAQRDREFADTTKRLSDENEVLHARLAAAKSVPARAYAERMRFDKVCVSNSPADAQGEIAQDRDRPGADAVVLERTDYDILVANTVRLQAVREWGLSLQAAGVAE